VLTVAKLREHVPTTLGDDALGRLLDDAYAAVAAEVAPAGTVSEMHHAARGRLLMLNHQASGIVSVTERATSPTPVVLDPSDYRLRPSGSLLERLETGTHPRGHWWDEIDVLLTTVDDEAQRDRAVVDLVHLELNFNPGLAAYSTGVYSETYASGGGAARVGYDEHRLEILASVHPGEAVGVY
jgi:hypothetical protein